jgi:hypothetical protein
LALRGDDTTGGFPLKAKLFAWRSGRPRSYEYPDEQAFGPVANIIFHFAIAFLFLLILADCLWFPSLLRW